MGRYLKATADVMMAAFVAFLIAWALPATIAIVLASDGHTDITLNNVVVTDADTIRGDVLMAAEVGEPLYWNVRVKTRPIEVELLAQRIRVVGVDSPELRTPKGDAAKLAVEKLIEGKTIRLTPRGKDNFGRLLAIVTLVDKDGKETILADWLIKNRHGIVYKP